MTRPTGVIGSVRRARDLKRGDHVRLTDGRWGLLLAAPVANAVWKERLTASVCIEMRHQEGVSWGVGDTVFSRSPDEQMQHVESVFAELREAAKGGES